MTFVDGMGELTEKIAASLDKSKILLGRSVTRLEKTADGKFMVYIEGMDPVRAEAVILAAPAHNAAEIVREADKTLADNLAAIPLATSATVNLAFRRADVKDSLQAFGFIVPISEKRKVKAGTYSSTKWNHRTPGDEFVLIRAFVGGARNQELVLQEDEDLLKMVLDELKDIIGLTAKPVMHKIYRWIKGMPQYTVGHLERVEAIDRRTAAMPGLYVVGGSYKGVGVPDCINVGTQAAQQALNLIKSSADNGDTSIEDKDTEKNNKGKKGKKGKKESA